MGSNLCMLLLCTVLVLAMRMPPLLFIFISHLFRYFNHHWSVDQDELSQLMMLLGMPVLNGQMAHMISEIASIDSKEISLEDFLSAMKSEGQNSHLSHLLLIDFERFRPNDCPRDHIPMSTLVDLLTKHFVKEEEEEEEEDVGEEMDSKLSPVRNEGKERLAASQTSKDERDDGHGQNVASHKSGSVTNSSGDLSPNSSKETLSQGDKSGEWTAVEIRDILKQIPPECYHESRSDLINFNMLVNMMLGDAEEDPFSEDGDK